MGVKLQIQKSNIEIFKSSNIKKINISTQPYPGFPTDLQAQLMVLFVLREHQKLKKIFLKIDLCTSQNLRNGANIEIKIK